MKKKVKAFFTMTRKHEGFTLVELIVVIAILAILGGVAVPAYSGYVKKADRAADEALLVEINTAFASACSLNGENYFLREDTDLDFQGGKSVKGLKISVEKVATDFELLFESEEVEFKAINPSDIMYAKDEGRFREAQLLTINYGRGTLVISEKDKELFLDSALAGIGVDVLLDQMDNVIQYAAGRFAQVGGLDAALATLKTDEEFLRLCNKYPGYANATPEEKEKIEMLALTQYTAMKAQDRNTEDLYNQIINSPGSPIVNDGELDVVANASMYALALTFAETDEGLAVINRLSGSSDLNGEQFDPNNPDHLIKLMAASEPKYNEDGDLIQGESGENCFAQWMSENEDTAKDSISGFQGTMGMLDDNEENLDTDMLLAEGYGNEDLSQALTNGLADN